jgi:Ca2+-binding RTX toxin-like protein
MRRALLLAVLVSGLLVAFAGVAWADFIPCMGGRCEGTQDPDVIEGTEGIDRIFALGGGDFVEAFGGADEINGQNGSDRVHGDNGNDTHNGGNGPDSLEEFSDTTGRDVMNGGTDTDFMQGGPQADILRGQDGDECFQDSAEGIIFFQMFGDEGNDDLFGNAGEDCMEGEEGTDEHYGGADNDVIDALDGDLDPVTGDPLGTHDVVDCGGGFDHAAVNRDEDIVRGNCEDVFDISATSTAVAPPTFGTTEEEQQQAREAFIQEHGLAPEPAG